MLVQAPPRPVVLPSKLIDLILSGRCTRLLVPPAAEPAHLPPYPISSRVAVQPAGNEAARVWIILGRATSVMLGGPEVRQELDLLGYRDVYELQADWIERFGPWRDAGLAWLYRIAVDQAAPSRLLHRDSSRGYTTQPAQALAGEKEAVDDHALAAGRRAAHAAEHARLAQIRSARTHLPLPERLRLIIDDAQRRDMPLTPEINNVRDRIAALEQRILRPVDRFRDADVKPPEDPPPRRRHPPLSEETRVARERRAETRKPGKLEIRHVDPADVAPGRSIPPAQASSAT